MPILQKYCKQTPKILSVNLDALFAEYLWNPEASNKWHSFLGKNQWQLYGMTILYAVSKIIFRREKGYFQLCLKVLNKHAF